MQSFDVVVIGAGPAGETVAGRCADGGLSVAIVERELVGGECSYWGCMPSKTLIRPGDVLAAARRVPAAAAAITGPLDVDAAFAARNRITGDWDDRDALPWLEERGIAVVRGAGRLAAERRVDVEAAEGTVESLEARRAVVVATGTSAALPPVPGLTEAHPWDNRDVTATKKLPRRLLAREEPFAADEVRTALEAEGIAVHTGVGISRVERDGSGPVTAVLADGTELVADELLVAAGRRPATTALGLDRVGLAPGKFIEVDDQLRATAVAGGWLYAVGDCNGRALLTHMGKYQARIAADVILGKEASSLADHGIVPRVTFTDPQVCAVGRTEADAREQEIDVRTVRYATGGVAGAAVLGDEFPGTSQLVIDASRGVIVGATFVGPGVHEVLHSATIAIAGEVTIDRLWHAVPSFPTVSEVWLRLLEAYGA